MRADGIIIIRVLVLFLVLNLYGVHVLVLIMIMDDVAISSSDRCYICGCEI